jgi:hypothetical protein
MHVQPSYSPEQIDAAIMGLLLDERFHLWAIVEVEREIGDRVETRDSLSRLRGAGLIYELDLGFVFATRAARLGCELPL